MVVARGDIRHDRAESVEGGLVAVVELTLHVLAYLVHRHVSRPLNEGLHILVPGTQHELAHRVKFGKLSSIVSVGRAARAQTVAERESHVILSHDVTYLVEVVVEERLLIVDEAPFAHDAATAADYAAET